MSPHGEMPDKWCPRCGGWVNAAAPRALDSIVGALVPMRRLKCFDLRCGWTGTEFLLDGLGIAVRVLLLVACAAIGIAGTGLLLGIRP